MFDSIHLIVVLAPAAQPIYFVLDKILSKVTQQVVYRRSLPVPFLHDFDLSGIGSIIATSTSTSTSAMPICINARIN